MSIEQMWHDQEIERMSAKINVLLEKGTYECEWSPEGECAPEIDGGRGFEHVRYGALSRSRGLFLRECRGGGKKPHVAILDRSDLEREPGSPARSWALRESL